MTSSLYANLFLELDTAELDLVLGAILMKLTNITKVVYWGSPYKNNYFCVYKPADLLLVTHTTTGITS